MGEAVLSSEDMEAKLKAEAEAKKDRVESEKKDGGECDSSVGTMRWDKLLPTMNMRVLLVEADDSTRHIIAALLRKCSYRGQWLFSFLAALLCCCCFCLNSWFCSII